MAAQQIKTPLSESAELCGIARLSRPDPGYHVDDAVSAALRLGWFGIRAGLFRLECLCVESDDRRTSARPGYCLPDLSKFLPVGQGTKTRTEDFDEALADPSLELSDVLVGALDELAKHLLIDILHFLDVQTGTAGLVLTELVHQLLMRLEACHDVNGKRLLPG